MALPWSKDGAAERRPELVKAVVGAARPINIRRRAEIDRLRMRPTNAWQRLAWRYYDAIGEVKRAYNYYANAMSRVRLYVGYLPEGDGGAPVPIGEVGRVDRSLLTAARYELNKISENIFGGQPGLMRAYSLNMKIAGDGYLINNEGRWGFYSTNELRVESTDRLFLVPRREVGQADYISLSPDAFVARIWRPHPAFHEEADSAMLGIMDPCEEILLYSRLIRSTVKSRLNAGILYVADELRFERAHGAAGQPDPAAGTGDELAEDDDEIGDPFEEELSLALTEPIDDDASPSAVVPMLVRGPSALAKDAITKIDLSRPFDEEIVKLREGAMARMVNGIDLPNEVVTGFKDLRYSNAQVISEDLYKSEVEPGAVHIAEALTACRLRPALLARGYDREQIARVVVWYDPSEVVVKPDRSADADAGHDRILISDSAWRRSHGFTEGDKPDDEEYSKRLAAKSTLAPETAIQLLSAFVPAISELVKEHIVQLIPQSMAPPSPGSPGAPKAIEGSPAAIEAGDQPTASGTPTPPPHGNLPPREGTPDQPPPSPQVGPRTVRVRTPPTGGSPRTQMEAVRGSGAPTAEAQLRQLLEVERRLRAELLTLAEDTVARALDKSGAKLVSKLRSKPTAERLKNVPKAQVAAVLGREAVRAAGYDDDQQLVSDSAEEAKPRYQQLLQRAFAQQARILGADPGNNPPDIDAGWDLLKALIIHFAVRNLYRQDAGKQELSVPTDEIRQVLARVGGQLAYDPDGVVRGESTTMSGAVYSLRALESLLNQHDAEVVGHRWVYGISANHFEPHLELDGREFADWTDPVLRNESGWPRTEFYYPGDHVGCFVAGTVVSGPPAVGSSVRWYDGPGVVLRTASGQQLTATVNHPILTRRGWVAAGDLVPGDQVVRSLRADLGLVDPPPDDQQMPARIEDLAATLNVNSAVLSRPVSVAAEHFHGDGRYSQVAVVRSDSRLHARGEAALAQQIEQPLLVGAVTTTARGLALGVGSQPVGLLDPPRHRVAAGAAACSAPLRPEALVGQPHRRRDAASRHAALRESVVDRLAADAEISSELIDRFAGPVALDQVVQVRRTELGCHVYNLQTEPGWYLAGGIIAHNCHCDWMPALRVREAA